MTSIKARLAGLAFVLFVTALFFAAVFVLQSQRGSLEVGVDTSLETRADDIVALLEQNLRPQFLGINADEDTFAMVLSPQGAVITSTDRFADPLELDRLELDDRKATVELESFGETAGTDRMRVSAAFGPRGERVYVGESLRRVDQQVDDLRTTLLLTSSVLAIIAAAITAFAVGRALQPVELMRREADQISLAGLDKRLPEPLREDELGELTATFNAMLERLETGSEVQQQLIADIAHELRSPLTAIAAIHEVDLEHPQSADWPNSAAEALDETGRLQRLIDNLLLLARIDAANLTAANQLVDLDEIVNTTIDRLLPTTSVAIDRSGVSAGLVRGDAIQLDQIVRNLLDNAIRHADTTVTVSLADTSSLVELTVANDGDTVEPEETERIFDRFYRTQSSRDRESGGTGLGLAITKSIIDLHGGHIVATSTPPGTTITARLPGVHDDAPQKDTATPPDPEI